MKPSMEKLIGFGGYQIAFIILQYLSDIVLITNISFMIYGGIVPTMSCTSSEWDEKQVCSAIAAENCTNLTLVSRFHGISQEWYLICDKIGAVYLSMSAQMAGVMVGAPCFGQISDLWGRKKTTILTFGGLLAMGGASSFSPNITVFTALRFFIGFFCGGLATAEWVFIVEFLRERDRLWVGCLGSPIAYTVFSLIAYLTQEWRKMALVVNIYGVPILCLLFLMKESPRWLLQQGRIAEAKAVLVTVAKLNRQPINEELLRSVLDSDDTGSETKSKAHSFWHLFYTRDLTKYSIVLPCAWFTVSCVSYGLVFNIGNLSGSPYLNGLFYGLFRIAISLLIIALDVTRRNKQWPGRKFYHTFAMSVIAVSCTVLFILSAAGKKEESMVVFRVLSLLSMGLAGLVWMVVYLVSAELYPTPIRNIANSFCSVWARVGGIVAPQILYLAHYWSPAAFFTYACIATVNVILFQLVIPETKNQPLPELMPPRFRNTHDENAKSEKEPMNVTTN